LCALLFLPIAVRAQSPQSADQELAAGERLIRANCGVCANRDGSEFDRGVALVEKALREGVKDRRKALLLLADVYLDSTVIVHREGMQHYTAEQMTVRYKRAADVFEELLRDDPGSVPLRMRYAGAISYWDPPKALQIYSDVLKIQPDHAEAAFRIALVGVETGQVKTGVEAFLQAAHMATASPEMIQRYGGEIAQYVGQEASEMHGDQKYNEYIGYVADIYSAIAQALEKRGARAR
jgi:tetratricopeptide (TPR) repeat protein